MTMEVLQDKFQIRQSRQELIRKGAFFAESPVISFLRRFGFVRGIGIGYMLKSWDVLSTVEFLESHVQRDESILDIGCYASELIVVLHKLGYSKLSGVDLNPNLHNMPYQGYVRYENSDFMHTKYEDAVFRAITSISVIEHGFDSQSLLKEMSRLLMPGGYFIASFDYWPEKIDTTGIKLFGMDWKIFSKDEIVDFINEAADYGMFPLGEMMYDGKDKSIRHGGKQYTFAWVVLKRSV